MAVIPRRVTDYEVGAGGGDYGRRSMGAAASGATKRFSLYHFSSMMHVGRITSMIDLSADSSHAQTKPKLDEQTSY